MNQGDEMSKAFLKQGRRVVVLSEVPCDELISCSALFVWSALKPCLVSYAKIKWLEFYLK